MAAPGTPGRGEAALLAALLQGKSTAEAAAAAGLSPRTVQRRLADPAFVCLLHQARARALARAINILAEGATSAAVQLRWLAVNATQEHVRLAAARSILEYALRGLEALDLPDRIAALEHREAQRWGA
jgi:hypothetical protein